MSLLTGVCNLTFTIKEFHSFILNRTNICLFSGTLGLDTNRKTIINPRSSKGSPFCSKTLAPDITARTEFLKESDPEMFRENSITLPQIMSLVLAERMTSKARMITFQKHFIQIPLKKLALILMVMSPENRCQSMEHMVRHLRHKKKTKKRLGIFRHTKGWRTLLLQDIKSTFLLTQRTVTTLTHENVSRRHLEITLTCLRYTRISPLNSRTSSYSFLSDECSTQNGKVRYFNQSKNNFNHNWEQ